MHLFQSGGVTLSAGGTSFFKLDCDDLLADRRNEKCIAELLLRLVGPFDSWEIVSGNCSGLGYLFSAAHLERVLEEPVNTPDVHPHVILDDVLTTGRSLERAKAAYLERAEVPRPVLGAVIFARGPAPAWVKVLCQLPKELWLPEA
jgi:hypothetical protein